MAQIQTQANYYLAQLDKELSKYHVFNQVESLTGAPKTYSAIGVGAVFFFLIFFNVWARFLSNLLGWALPAYLSFKALQTKTSTDDTQWLTYWVIFGFLNFIESLSILVAWFPYYYTFKTVFIIYLISPTYRGAEVIYTRVLLPVTSHSAPVAAPAAPAVAVPATPAS